MDYVGPIPDIKYYGSDEMGREREGTSCLGMMSRKTRSLINDACCNSIAKMTSVLRQASQIFRRDFIESGNIEVFLDALTIASACNKVLRKKFQKPETVGLIPAGVYSANNRYSKKALIWLLHMEQTDGCQIHHA